MNKEKRRNGSAINVENNPAGYFPTLTAITIQTRIKNSTKKNRFVV